MTGTGLPRLIVADSSEPVSEITDSSATESEVCVDARGEVLGYCQIVDGLPRMHVTNLAAFHYERDSDQVRAVPLRPLSVESIIETFQHCVLPVMLPALGTEVLHASAVVGTKGVAAFCGVSGAGKSTIAAALTRRGYRIWADDAVAFETAESEPRAIPLPFAVRLRADSARFLKAAGTGENAVPSAPIHTEPAPLAMLCLLRRTPEATDTVVIERLQAAPACRAVLAHAYCFSVKDLMRKRRTISNYLRMIGRVPTYEIRFRPGLERVSLVVDAVEQVIGSASMDRR
jgi:hypothetical protein